MPTRERVQDFISLVERGEYVKAIEDFYDPEASMQENGEPPRVGRQTLIEHERAVLASLKGMRTAGSRPISSTATASSSTGCSR
jgi:hypothetical protein